MPANATQQTRRLAVFTPFGEDRLLLTHLDGTEGVSELFEFQLTMLSDETELDGAAVCGRNVTIAVRDEADRVRYFNGFVSRFTCCGIQDDACTWKATVVPWLWFLTQTADCRIFQNCSTPEILTQVFTGLGFRDFDISLLTADYRPRDYCVQYRETDFDFVSRLMEEEGIFYFFRHEDGRHELVLADSNTAFEDIERANEIEMAAPGDSGDLNEQLTEWRQDYAFVPGRFTQTDFDFRDPDRDLMRSSYSRVSVKHAEHLDVYEYPGRYGDGRQGERLAKIRMEESEVRHAVVAGAGTYQTMTSGGRFQLRAHPNSALTGRRFVLTSVRHSVRLGWCYSAGHREDEPEFLYHCQFRCIPAEVPFRPQRKTRKPTVDGVQTAVVTGPPGEQIFPDEFGRVKVQFHWDREGHRDQQSSCWIRVSQVHAGAGWGMIDLPRIGEEVIVSFLDGDPDRPIIKGRVYNAEARVPFSLPEQKTRSGGKSNTHKGGGYNEITADDTAGMEQIRISAQHNMDTTISNNETLNVGVDRSEVIGNNDSLKVAVDATAVVGNDQKTIVGTNATYEVAGEITITAGTSITLKCGSSTIHMNQAGVITISGQFVSSIAKASHTIVAPFTEIAGAKLLNQSGLICMDVSGVKHIKGGETNIRASLVNVSGDSATVIKGNPLALGDAGAPVVVLPAPTDAASAAASAAGSGAAGGDAGAGSDAASGGQTSTGQTSTGSAATGSAATGGAATAGSVAGTGEVVGENEVPQDDETGGGTADPEDANLQPEDRDGPPPATKPSDPDNGLEFDPKDGLQKNKKLQEAADERSKNKAGKQADEVFARYKEDEARAGYDAAKQNYDEAAQKVGALDSESKALAHSAQSPDDFAESMKKAGELDAAKADSSMKASQLDDAAKALDETSAARKVASDAVEAAPSGKPLASAGRVLSAAGLLGDAIDAAQAFDDVQKNLAEGNHRGAAQAAGAGVGDFVGGNALGAAGAGAFASACVAAGVVTAGAGFVACAVVGGIAGGVAGGSAGKWLGDKVGGAVYDAYNYWF